MMIKTTHFPMRELVRRTGVNASTLRAWEHRHGLIRPARAPSGHRLYSERDVHRVRRVQELLVQGLGLNEIALHLEQEDLAGGHVAETIPVPDTQPPGGAGWQAYIHETLRALDDFSVERLDAIYNEACAIYPIDLLTQNLLIPVLEQIGRQWEERPSGIAEEHFFTAWLRNKLGARLHHASSLPKGKPILMATLPNDHHEIGLLLFALGTLHMGHRVVYMGANLPLRQLPLVAEKTHAQAIVLAGRTQSEPDSMVAEIEWLLGATPVPVFVGSHFSLQAETAIEGIGAMPLGVHIPQGLARMATLLGQVRPRKIKAVKAA